MGMLDGILDRSILFSFDRSGFERHKRDFDPADLGKSMRDRVCLVTGANAGLGRAVAFGLAAREATVHMLCRDPTRGEEARIDIVEQTGNQQVHLRVVDVADLGSIRGFADRFSAERVHALIHNAGVLPLSRELTDDGLERTVATHLVGPHLLTHLLRPRLDRARIVFVSSGGMYAKRLSVDALTDHTGPYDGVAAYAMTKRGQVVLSELWAEALAGSGTTVNAMHPGWAATGGVQRALPRFSKLMRHRLRTAQQGADTALWLAVAERVAGISKKFWFDRAEAPTHLVPWTRETETERQRLWDFCQEESGLTRS